MDGMNVNISDAAKQAQDEARLDDGRFGTQKHSAPEAGLGGGAAPIIINSPAGGDRRTNLWIVVPEGQAVEMNVFEAGIGRPMEDSWREDTITFRRTDEGVRAVYEVSDDDVSAQFEEAFAEVDEDEAEAMRFELRRAVQDRTGGTADVFFNDGRVEFRHTSDHLLDDYGGFFTANVFNDLENDRAYVLNRDGVLLLSAYDVLSAHNFTS